MIRSGEVCEQIAIGIVRIDDKEARERLLSEIAARRLDRAGAERLLYAYIKKRAKKEKNRSATYLIRDIRIFYNTIDRALEVMRSAGYQISAVKTDDGEGTTITIKIPN